MYSGPDRKKKHKSQSDATHIPKKHFIIPSLFFFCPHPSLLSPSVSSSYLSTPNFLHLTGFHMRRRVIPQITLLPNQWGLSESETDTPHFAGSKKLHQPFSRPQCIHYTIPHHLFQLKKSNIEPACCIGKWYHPLLPPSLLKYQYCSAFHLPFHSHLFVVGYLALINFFGIIAHHTRLINSSVFSIH